MLLLWLREPSLARLSCAGVSGYSTISVPFMLDYTRQFGHFSRKFLAEQAGNSICEADSAIELHSDFRAGEKGSPFVTTATWRRWRRACDLAFLTSCATRTKDQDASELSVNELGHVMKAA